MKIKTLNQETINKIAAGEVILRPASVVKELVENSIDAGAKKIVVEVDEGGKRKILVRDNGIGISYDEVPLAFKCHTTSKISHLSDLDDLKTMGFRGEALSSIIACADVLITTRFQEEELGSQTVFKDGILKNQKVYPYEKGTEIIVTDLFESIPARHKFLNKDETEERKIRDIMEKLAISHPDISFTYSTEGRKIFHTSGSGNLQDVARNVFGQSFSSHLHKFYEENLPMKIYGLMGDLDARRTYRANQIFFINGRFVKDKMLSQAFEDEWAGKLMQHQYPSGIIFIELPQRMLDVNVHPQKEEIRILNQSLVSILFKQCIKNAIDNLKLIPEDYIHPELESKKPVEKSEIINQETFEDPIKDILPLETASAPAEKNIKLSSKLFETNNEPLLNPDDYYQELLKEAKDVGFINSIDKEYVEEETDRNNVEDLHDEVKPPEIKKQEIIKEAENITFEDYRENLGEEDSLSLENMKLIGQIFNTYILVEKDDILYIIDQHAAHEAILYEIFSRAFREGEGFQSQGLLVPAEVAASRREIEAFKSVYQKLRDFGFEAEAVDERIIVKAVPMIADNLQPPELIIALISWFSGMSSKAPEAGLDRIITISCKSAVKAGDKLNDDEINELLSKLFKLKNPYTCPHGRPVIRKRSEYELEKLFKRVV